MKKRTKIIIFSAIAAISIIFLFITLRSDDPDKVCINTNCFDVEFVSEPQERQQGLMYRESLDNDAGMLFMFESSGIYPFWMKNTLIPLDMIWISEDKKVSFIKENAPPCTADPCEIFTPGAEALYVLEVNAGTVSELGISVDDTVIFK